MSSRQKRGAAVVLRVFILSFFLLFVMLPIYWMAITSFKPHEEIINTQLVTYFPHTFTLDNYRDLFKIFSYGDFLRNSIILSVSTAVAVTILSIFGGYGLARYRFRGKTPMLLFFLITQMVPGILVIIPLYTVYAKMGIIANVPHLGLWIFYVITNLPFCVITMRSFFEGIPYSLEEAAMVDGCSRMRSLRKVILPVMFPGIVAVFVFAFIGAWNELIAGIIFTSEPSAWTIPVGLKSLIGKNNVKWGAMMAGGMLALVPTAVMFMIVQKYVVEGLTAGSVKE
ncbi:carbohydrate ABC transporter permease [Ruminococcus gauvreauii]|uniref:Carbohydrate ABC transporter permease n=1 Tax=Ruminococcus gauvreauii TaxID=438033 RepID=A0ABY5VHM6_9FIRM|nr:carbohydrate ABC transporter permease [Ruminococcus gauvreauii]UWP60115.1 carbohydrate ABC transporter permease [Ruminococcus gauvreauii]